MLGLRLLTVLMLHLKQHNLVKPTKQTAQSNVIYTCTAIHSSGYSSALQVRGSSLALPSSLLLHDSSCRNTVIILLVKLLINFAWLQKDRFNYISEWNSGTNRHHEVLVWYWCTQQNKTQSSYCAGTCDKQEA